MSEIQLVFSVRQVLWTVALIDLYCSAAVVLLFLSALNLHLVSQRFIVSVVIHLLHLRGVLAVKCLLAVSLRVFAIEFQRLSEFVSLGKDWRRAVRFRLSSAVKSVLTWGSLRRLIFVLVAAEDFFFWRSWGRGCLEEVVGLSRGQLLGVSCSSWCLICNTGGRWCNQSDYEWFHLGSTRCTASLRLFETSVLDDNIVLFAEVFQVFSTFIWVS